MCVRDSGVCILSPCCLRCCRPWCCSCPSASSSLSPRTSRPDHWATHPHLGGIDQNRQRAPLQWRKYILLVIHSYWQRLMIEMGCDIVSDTHIHSCLRAHTVPSDVSMTTSTSLKMPRRSSFCLAIWDFFMTCQRPNKQLLAQMFPLKLGNISECVCRLCVHVWVCGVQSAHTYINKVFSMEDLRDFIAQQILFGSSQALNVDMLDNNLQWMDRFSASIPTRWSMMYSAPFAKKMANNLDKRCLRLCFPGPPV